MLWADIVLDLIEPEYGFRVPCISTLQAATKIQQIEQWDIYLVAIFIFAFSKLNQEHSLLVWLELLDDVGWVWTACNVDILKLVISYSVVVA